MSRQDIEAILLGLSKAVLATSSAEERGNLESALHACSDAVAQARDDTGMDAALTELRGQMKRSPRILQHLEDEIVTLAKLVDARSRLLPDLASSLTRLSESFQFDPLAVGETAAGIVDSIEAADLALIPQIQKQDRSLTLRLDGGFHAESYKIKNLALNRLKLLEVATHAICVGGHTYENPNPILFGLGILLLIRTVTEAFEIRLSEEDASVIWGLIKAQGQASSAAEPDIKANTNRGRELYDLNPLGELALRKSLQNLNELGSVERLATPPFHWKVTEHYRIKK